MKHYSRSSSGGAFLGGCGFIILILLISAAVGAFCWPYTINSWLSFADKPQTIVWWQGALLGLVPWLGQASIPAAVITWVLMLFLL